VTERVQQTSASKADAGRRLRIALCHLDSLVGLPALNVLFAELGDQIDLVILSKRFGPRHGSVLHQLTKGVRRSGWRMTLWLGFDIVSVQLVSPIATLVTRLTGRPPALRSARALAAQYGAQVLECSDVNAPEATQALRDAAIDWVVVMNFDQILRQPFIQTPALGVVNLHPSLLPALRGPCPVFWALAERYEKVGITLHVIDTAEIDAGPIIEQLGTNVDPQLSVAEITSMLFQEGARLVAGVARKGADERCSPQPQRCDPRDYRGFPGRAFLASAAARRVRLCRTRHLVALVAAACGLAPWPSAARGVE
jgi:folate-dependent phosphoribosylglycinamide formyltransferase PurN